MRLNPDCIRDILLTIEDLSKPSSVVIFSEDTDYLHFLYEKYDVDTLNYHIEYCENADLIQGVLFTSDFISVNDLSPKGHDFLANIRDDTNWKNIKIISAKIGSKGLDALVQISSNVITTLIKAQFGI